MNAYNRKYKFIETAILVMLDLLCMIAAMTIAMAIRHGMGDTASFMDAGQQVIIAIIMIGIFVSVIGNGYHNFPNRGRFMEMIHVGKSNALTLLLSGFYLYAFRLEGIFSRLVLLYFIIINSVLTVIGRLVLKAVLQKVFRRTREAERFFLVLNDSNAKRVLHNIKEDKGWSYLIEGIAITDKNRVGETIEGYPVLATGDDVIDVVRQHAVDAVLVNCPENNLNYIELIVQSFLAMGIICHNCVDRLQVDAPCTSVGKFAGMPVMSYSMTLFDYRKRLIKRLFDIFASFIGLVGTAILTPFIALAIFINDPGPIFFSQTRIGKNGRRFKMYKFRSMYTDAEERKKELMSQNQVKGLMFKMDNDPRITPVGKFIRKTSLDELPQFWNIFKGDMSLVGTRPPTVDEFDQYNVYYRRRLSITPGLTGMWQVSGRSDIDDFDEVVRLDLQYIDNWSLSLDLKIILQTVGVVLFGRGSK